MAPLIWLAAGALAVADWVAIARRAPSVEAITKPLTVVALILAAVASGATETAPGWWLLVALLLSVVGDVLLLSEQDTPVLVGLLVFLAVHSVYIVCFLTLGLDAPAWATTGAVMTLLGLVVAHSVLPSAQRRGGIPLAAPVAAYMVALGGMQVVAWGVGRWQIALGATFFVISNTVLGINRWVRPLRDGRLAVMVAYHLAQALFVLGVTSVA